MDVHEDQDLDGLPNVPSSRYRNSDVHDANIEDGVLLPKGIAGTSKRGKGSKKVTNPVPTPKKVTKPIQVQDPKESAKEVVPSKYGVLKKLKKMAHRSRHSPERQPIIKSIPEQFISSHKEMFASKINKIRKPRSIARG
ncbi:unnamed protein product [Lactuca virosa]|uniref:Uncharacterized protein n=1 Tax=Lactuca virosa TaxID=75947 RepID=A0AAU9PQZ2_9ASTR|nr:unnamed protein product [Lactuca virosa]